VGAVFTSAGRREIFFMLSIRYKLVPVLAVLGLLVSVVLKVTGLGQRFYNQYVLDTYPNLIAAGVSISCLIALACVFRYFESRDSVFSKSGPAGQGMGRAWIVAIFLGLLWVALCFPTTFRCLGDARMTVPHWIDDAITLDQVTDFLTGSYTIPSYRFTQGWPLFLSTVVVSSGLSKIVPVDISFVDGFMRFQQLAVLFCLIIAAFLLIYRLSGSLWVSACVSLVSFSDISTFFTAVRSTRLDNLQVLVFVLCLYFGCKFYKSGSARDWFFTVFFAACAFAARYSGHLFLPVLGTLWLLHYTKKSSPIQFGSGIKCLMSSSRLFLGGVIFVFLLTFFLMNPYHVYYFDQFISAIRDLMRVYSSDLEFDSFKRVPISLLTSWWHALTVEATPEVFSKAWPTLVLARSSMVVLSITGTVAAVVRIMADLRKGQKLAPPPIGDSLFVIWLVSYWAFVLLEFRGRFILRTYIEPVFFVMSYFAIAQFYWLFQWSRKNSRVLFRSGGILLWGAVSVWTLWYSSQAFANSFRDLAIYRDPSSNAMGVGKYLDDRISKGHNPVILNTHFAYIPTRFTNILVHNVDVTSEFLKKNNIEYIVVDDFLFDYLADIDMKGKEDWVYKRFNVKYADVTKLYSALKNDQCPDFRRIARIGQFSIFESKNIYAEVPMDWNLRESEITYLPDYFPKKSYWEGVGNEILLETNEVRTSRILSVPITPLRQAGEYAVSGSIVFSPKGKSQLGGIGMGVFDESRKTYTSFQYERGWRAVDFSLRFRFDPLQSPLNFVLANGGRPVKQELSIQNLRLVSLLWQQRREK